VRAVEWRKRGYEGERPGLPDPGCVTPTATVAVCDSGGAMAQDCDGAAATGGGRWLWRQGVEESRGGEGARARQAPRTRDAATRL